MRIESSFMNLQGSSYNSSLISQSDNFQVIAGGNGGALSIGAMKLDASAIESKQQVTEFKIVQPKKEEWLEGLPDKFKLRAQMLETFLTALTGKRVRLALPSTENKNQSYDNSGNAVAIRLPNQSGISIGYNRTEIQMEHTRVSFSAQGVVNTSDGRTINLDMQFNVDQQVFKASQTSLQLQGSLRDPLVINFDGGLPGFRDQTMTFDIDADGQTDNIHMLSAGSGYLALDKNGNGVIDDGTELFGPKTDQGYAELAEYDSDGNGWIDENDEIFGKLKIWYHDEDGNSRLEAITEKNIGAIYLGYASTKMDMYSQNGLAGRMRESGLVLLETGETRIMQELDVKI